MRLLLRILLLASSVLLLSGVGVVGYFLQDQDSLIQRGERYFEQQYGLSLTIGGVDLPSWRSFPDIQLTLREVQVRHPQDSFSTLSLQHLDGWIRVMDFWSAEVRLDKVQLGGGRLALGAEDQLVTHLQKLAKELKDQQKTISDLKVSVNPDLILSVEEVEFHYRDGGRRKDMLVCIPSLKLDFEDLEADEMSGNAELELQIEHLIFNPDKGSYLEQTALRMAPQFHFSSGLLQLPHFDLWLNDERFTTEAELGLQGEGWFSFDLQNDNTPFASTIRMVPQELQYKLAAYQVSRPLATRVRVQGAFAAGDNPLARIDFETTDNSFGIAGYPEIQGVKARGYLLNRASQDSSHWAAEHRLNLRLHFDAFEGRLAQSRVQFSTVDVTFTPKDLLRVKGEMEAEGAAETINSFLTASDWSIQGGVYQVQTKFEGPVGKESDLPALVRNLQVQLFEPKMVHASKGEVVGVEEMKLSVADNKLNIIRCLLELPGTSESIALQGEITDLSVFLDSDREQVRPSLSLLHLSSPRLSWNSVESLILEGEDQQTDNWQGLLGNVLQYLNPKLEIQIDTFNYADYQVKQLQAVVQLVNDSTFDIAQARGRLLDNDLQLAGELKFGAAGPVGDFALSAQGPTAWFNSLFANNTFFFEEGQYQFAGAVNTKLLNRSSLVRNTTGTLSVSGSTVSLGPTAVSLPLDQLQVLYDGTDLEVETLMLPLPQTQPIELSGQVENFHHLLTTEGQADAISSSFQLRTSSLSFQNFQRIFTSVQEVTDGQTAQVERALKPSLQTLYRKFHPCLTLEIDTFQYDQFYTTANQAQLSFLDENQLAFRNTGFEFKGRPVQLAATVNIADASETPFELTVETERFDLGALVETYDYFGLTSLQRAEKVAGKVSLKAQLQGKIVDSVGFQKDRMLGQIQFNLHEAELVNFAPIQEVANKFFRTERLHTIRFAPITDTLLITHRVVHIPRMEIQSTAFNLFVEGHLNYDNNTNIWVSLPWQNLRSWQEGELPEKTGYAESGGKLFVEITEEDGAMKYRLRLTNRRLYRHRGIPDQYRIDKREERAIRRAYRKQRRQARRIGA